GATSNISSIAVAVSNVAPTVTLSGPGSASEGQSRHYTFSTSDPGQDTFSVVSITASPDATLSNQSFDSATGAGSFDVTFLDGPNTSTVSVQVQDSDGANSNVFSIAVAVSNVAPTVTLSGPGSASEGQSQHYTFSTSDPGQDTFSVVKIGRASG